MSGVRRSLSCTKLRLFGPKKEGVCQDHERCKKHYRLNTDGDAFNCQCLTLAKEQRATSQAIADSLDHVKTEALQLRTQICEELGAVEEKCDSDNLDQYDKEALSRRMREILHQCYKFGFEVGCRFMMESALCMSQHFHCSVPQRAGSSDHGEAVQETVLCWRH